MTNVFPDGNKGGAAITCATIAAAQKAVPDARVTLIATQVSTDDFCNSHRFTLGNYPDAEVVMPLIEIKSGPLSGIRAVLSSLRMLVSRRRQQTHPVARQIPYADVVVSKGGYVFVERHSLHGLMSNWLTAFPLVLAARAGTPTAAVGATIGPFTTWYSRMLNGWILRQLDVVVTRDEYSFATALEIGVSPDRLVMLPDVVFSHAGANEAVRSKITRRYDLDQKRSGVVAIAEGPGDAEFLPSLSASLVELVWLGVIERILVVIQSQQDLAISRAFVAALPTGMAELIEDDLSPEELMAVYGAGTFVIARRMHAAIFAMVAGAPTFAVAKYAMKVQGVMRSLGLEDYLVDYPKVDATELTRRIADAATNRDEVVARVTSSVAKAREELRELPNVIRSVAEKRSPRQTGPEHTTPIVVAARPNAIARG